MRTKLAAVVMCGSACVATLFQAVRAAGETAGKPWLDPAHAEEFVFIGKDVWDANTGKKIAAGAAPAIYQGSKAVAGAPGRFWLVNTPSLTPTLPNEGFVYSVDGAPSWHPTLDGTPVGNYAEYPGFWNADDLRRVVWIEKGDFWRGVANWASGKVDQRQQVTKLGVFTGKTPILWHRNLLFVDGRFDPAKPVVRIDLATGATEEMETHHVFRAGTPTYAAATAFAAMVSPSGRCLFDVTPELIYTYDVQTGKAGTIPNVFHNNPKIWLTTSTPQVIGHSQAPIWIAEDVFVCVNEQGVVSKIDIGRQQMEVLHGLHLSDPSATPAKSGVAEFVQLKGVLPGGHFFDMEVTTPSPDTATRRAFKERFLLDLDSGKVIPTSLGEEAANGSWIDDRRFLYGRKTGGLSGVGTWLYDRNTNAATRIAPGQIETTRMIVPRGRDELWAVNSAGGVTLIRAKFDGSGSEDLGPCMMAQPMQFPAGPPLDLGLAPDSPDPWAK